jgi:Tol biopolymer transport system component
MSAYLADLEPSGSKIANARQFTLDESINNPLDWTPDGKSILFISNRGDNVGIFKQSLDQETPQFLASLDGPLHSARVTPDCKWILWFDESKAVDKKEAARLMRVPIEGGTPEAILTRDRTGTLLCARPPSHVCAIAERSESRKQIVVSSFDPMSGPGPELARFNIDAVNEWACDISPDGTRLAAITGAEDPIRILDLSKQRTVLIPSEQLHEKQEVSWAADGHSLFVTHGVKGGSELVHLDFQGQFRSLWKNSGGYPPRGLPSPDGRHLAIRSSSESSNMWMMENF